VNVRSSSGIASNPVLIGAATILVLLVAVFLAYNANQGLPFVPTYQLKVDAPSAANLVRGNEVRVGGARVGTVSRIEAKRREDGTSFARLTLKLDKEVEPLAKDSRVVIRLRTALGLKYVELTPGRSSETFVDGDTIPLSASRPEQVEFDEFLNMFDAPTRAAMQRNLDGFGTAFAGRGAALNSAIGAFRPLLRDVQPVMQNLSSPETDLDGFVEGLAQAAAEVAPVAEQQADLFANLDQTFTALAEVARPYIQETISEGRPALQTAVRSLPAQRPFLANSTRFFAELAPGARALRAAAPDLATALETGTPALERSVQLNRRLEPVFRTISEFANDPLAPRGVRRLNETVTSLRPTLEFFAPTQTECNYVTLLLRNGSSLLSEGDAKGTWQRFNIIAIDPAAGANQEGLPSTRPANGPFRENYLHSNPYPNTGAPGQTDECEAGNEPWLERRQVIGNVPGAQLDSTELTGEPLRRQNKRQEQAAETASVGGG
jgi:virulence factor Mce-like protein